MLTCERKLILLLKKISEETKIEFLKFNFCNADNESNRKFSSRKFDHRSRVTTYLMAYAVCTSRDPNQGILKVYFEGLNDGPKSKSDK